MFEAFTLYPILDPLVSRSGNFEQDLRQIVSSGISIIQLRVKDLPDEAFLRMVWQAREATRCHNVTLIINDRPDIAKAVDADGVHVGHDDMSIMEAREFLGPGKIIGGSAEDLSEALVVQKAGADYVGVGSIFSTTTKKNIGVLGIDGLKKIKEKISIPVCAIGGITIENFTQVLDVGVNAVAVISDIFTSKDILSKVHEYNRKAEEYARAIA